MDNWSEIQQKRCGTYERNLRIKKLVDMGIPQVSVGKLQKPPIARQRVFQILQELEKAQEKIDQDWDSARDDYGTTGVEENDR